MDFKEITNLIWADKVEEFKSVISEDFEHYLNLKDYNGVTLLPHVINKGNFVLFKYLVENGADINYKDLNNVSLIHLASQKPSLDIFEYLLNLGADLELEAKYSSFGIIGELSAGVNNTKLLKKVIDKVKTVNSKDLARVLNRRNIEIAKYIIENKNISSEIIIDSMTDFLYGYNDDVIEFFDFLLDNKHININDTSTYNETFFKIVLNTTSHNIYIKYLVERGVDLAINGKTALFAMAGKNCLEGVKYIVEQGIDINSVSDYNQNALHYESSRYIPQNLPKETELSETFKYLLDNYCNISLIDNSNKLPIHNLFNNNRMFSVKYIFEKTVSQILEKNIEDEKKFNLLFSIQEIPGTKKEKDLLVNAFSKFPKLSSRFNNCLYEDKTKLREIAIKTLIKIDSNENLEALKSRAETESNKALLKVLNKYLEEK